MLEGARKPAITPFWNRIPQLFIYPLQPSGLVVLFALLVLFTVLPISLIGWLLRLVLVLFFTKYCYEVLAQTAEGRLRPPAVSGELLREATSCRSSRSVFSWCWVCSTTR